MPLTISNNSAVASASYYLEKNQKNLQNSIKRLASGKKIVRKRGPRNPVRGDEAQCCGQPLIGCQEQCAERYLIC